MIENGTFQSKLVDISSTPEPYHKLDLIFSLYLNKFPKNGAQLRFFVENITNSDYRNYLNRMRYYASEIGRSFQIQLILNY